MAVAYRTSTTASALSGSLAVNPPSGLASGDLWVVIVCWDSATGTINLPSGWAGIGSQFGTTYPLTRAFYKTAGASESAVTVTFTGGDNDDKNAISVRIDGQHATTPIDAVGTPTYVTSSGTTAAPPSITVTGADSLGLTWCVGNSTATLTKPATATLAAQHQTSYVTCGASYESVGAGTYAPGNWTYSGSTPGRGAQTFSVAPAAGGGAQDAPELRGRPMGLAGQRQQTQLLAR